MGGDTRTVCRQVTRELGCMGKEPRSLGRSCRIFTSLLFLFTGCALPEEEILPMAQEAAPPQTEWRDGAGRIEARLATPQILLRFMRDEEGRLVGVMGIERPFDPRPGAKKRRHPFSLRDDYVEPEAAPSTWPTGGRVAWG